MKTLFNGLSTDKGSREYKLARIEVQRLTAPALAIIIPTLLVAGIVLSVGGTPKVQIMYTPFTEEPVPVPPLIITEPKEPEIVDPKVVENLPPIDILFDSIPEHFDTTTFTDKPQPVSTVLDAISPVKMPHIFAGPGGDRGDKIAWIQRDPVRGPGEDAVVRALRWLKKNQNADGSWPKTKPAMTGLALLCFLAHGEVPGDGDEFGDTVQRAIEYLLNSYNNGTSTPSPWRFTPFAKPLA
jgi:hypothetical protein